MKNKFVVYTALFGNYDDLIDPKENYKGCDFICFTDQKHLKSDVWEIRLVEECELAPNMMNRKYKILPHLFLSEYESSLYVDANIVFLKNPYFIKKTYLENNNIALPKHPNRDCIYNEALECIYLGKDKLEKIKYQLDMYKSNGMPKEFGLSENNIIGRNHNDNTIIQLMNDWWRELNMQAQTQRDQLSLPYLLWKNKLTYNFITEHSREHKSFSYMAHKTSIKNKLLKSLSYKCKKYLSFVYVRMLGI